MYAEVNTQPLKNMLSDFREACYNTIRDLLDFPGQSVTFDTDIVEECPYCIGDDIEGIIDGIISSVYINQDDNTIHLKYQDNINPNRHNDSDIRYLIHVDLIDLCEQICNKVNNG